ncbi:protein arginine methyltransferase 7 isoform X2 [Tasmannia lanceolata]|uniref:protein arginine methyltransferase 7 isoform X2 n=1 Tax=Tasmannia lanceolata TaxID=3420 RepID=UPI00406336B0
MTPTFSTSQMPGITILCMSSSLIFTFFLQSLTSLCSSTFRFSNCKPIRTMSSALPQRMFQQRLDPLTGNTEWVVIEEEEEDGKTNPNPNLNKALLSSTSYLDMLNDSARNRAFHEAIKKTVTRPCHVLDIGAGTGLLSMMAAKAMNSSDAMAGTSMEGMVSACESYLPMGKLMRKVIRINGMVKKVHIFHKRSDELKVGEDLTSRADILLVESKFLQKLHDLYGSEAHASDDIHLTPSGLKTIICVSPQQYAMHANAISKEIRLLSEPFKIFEFEFWKRPDSHGETALHIKATNDGTVHAIISWWVLQLDYEGKVFYSTAPHWIPRDFPGATNWCDHWKQCVWFIPGMGMPVSKGDQVYFQAIHSDTSITYDLRNGNTRTEIGEYDFQAGDFHLILSPERIAIYGDREWRHAMLTAARNALQGKLSPLCVVADDSVFLTILTASLSASSHVISMYPGLQDKGAVYLQAIADANGFSMDRVKVLGRRKTCLTLDDTYQRKVDLLFGEPFYYGNEGMLPWQNLRFWKERTILDSILSEDVVIMPCKGILKACAMSLPDLWMSRRSLKRIEGFDHSVVNETLGACGDFPAINGGPCLPYFIWQCGEIEELSEVFPVMEFNFSQPIRACFGKTKVRFTRPGLCHGFALWIDWVMDAENSIVVSTGPNSRYWKQGVKLLSDPVRVNVHGSCDMGECYSTELDASFNPTNGELIIKSAFLSQ